MTEHPMRKPSNKGKFFDVMRPGNTPANSTSRPVITNQHPHAKDITLKAKPIKPTPNSRSTQTQQRFTEFKPLTNIRPRSATPAQSEAQTSVEEPNVDSLFKHVDDEPLIAYKPRSAGRKILMALLIMLAVLLVVALVFDVLLDMGTLTYDIPHTHILKH